MIGIFHLDGNLLYTWFAIDQKNKVEVGLTRAPAASKQWGTACVDMLFFQKGK